MRVFQKRKLLRVNFWDGGEPSVVAIEGMDDEEAIA
jgi:hypothetical protein